MKSVISGRILLVVGVPLGLAAWAFADNKNNPINIDRSKANDLGGIGVTIGDGYKIDGGGAGLSNPSGGGGGGGGASSGTSGSGASIGTSGSSASVGVCTQTGNPYAPYNCGETKAQCIAIAKSTETAAQNTCETTFNSCIAPYQATETAAEASCTGKAAAITKCKAAAVTAFNKAIAKPCTTPAKTCNTNAQNAYNKFAGTATATGTCAKNIATCKAAALAQENADKKTITKQWGYTGTSSALATAEANMKKAPGWPTYTATEQAAQLASMKAAYVASYSAAIAVSTTTYAAATNATSGACNYDASGVPTTIKPASALGGTGN